MYHYIVFSIIFLFTYICFRFYKKTYYFSKLGIPQPYELPVFGIMHAIFFPRRHMNDFIKYIYATNEKAKYIGCNIFLTPMIVVHDPDLIKAVLVKNFEYFADRKSFVDEGTDPLFGQNLNFLNGERWREVRNMLSPTFTTSKMRSMYGLMSNCAEKFSDVFIKQYAEADAVDLKDVFGKYTNDVIASCAFGIEIDSLKNPKNEFYLRAKEVSTFQGFTMLKILLEIMFPTLTRKMGMRIISKELTDFFVNIIDMTIKVRNERGIIRPDMLQLMIDATNKIKNEKEAKFDLLEMTAQAFIFFLAGYESSSIQLCLIAQEVAMNFDVQKSLQIEIDSIMKATNYKPTYDVVNNNMPYLDAVFSETLRKHPIAFLNRQCSKEFELPPALPGAKSYKIKPGMNVIIPVAGIHNNSNYYTDPDLFNPERFINKKVTTTDALNLGFGMGPRMCIGNRFAILQTKILLVHLLSKCNLVISKKTCVPFTYCPNNFAPYPKTGFWLKASIRELPPLTFGSQN